MIENQGTTARVSAGYSVKLGKENYSSEDKHASFSLEFDLAGADFDDALAQLEQIEARLDQLAKAHVYSGLGMDYEETTAGTLRPVWPTPPQKSAGGGGQRRGGGGGGGQSRQRQPKVADEDKDIIVLSDGQPYYDHRPLKAAEKYAQGASDFKAVNKSNVDDQGRVRQYWLYDQNGEPNAATFDLLPDGDPDK